MRRVAIAAMLTLAACVPEPGDTEDACGAGALQVLVGQPLAMFDPASVKGPVRVIAPGMPVTMDYRAERLNVEHDAARIITRIICG